MYMYAYNVVGKVCIHVGLCLYVSGSEKSM